MKTKLYYILCLFLSLALGVSNAQDNYVDPWEDWNVPRFDTTIYRNELCQATYTTLGLYLIEKIGLSTNSISTITATSSFIGYLTRDTLIQFDDYIDNDTILWRFVDEHNETFTAIEIIHIADTISPIVNIPSDPLVYRMSDKSPFSQDCYGEFTISYSYITSLITDCSPIEKIEYRFDGEGKVELHYSDLYFQAKAGTHTIAYIVTDYFGNQTIAEQTIEVVDDVPPIVDCDRLGIFDIDIDVFQPEVARFDLLQYKLGYVLDHLSFVDECDGELFATLNRSDELDVYNDIYPAGETSLYYTFTDASGNSAVCEQRLFVNYLPQPPEFSVEFCQYDPDAKTWEEYVRRALDDYHWGFDPFRWGIQILDEYGRIIDISTKPDLTQLGETTYSYSLWSENSIISSGNTFKITVIGSAKPNVVYQDTYCPFETVEILVESETSDYLLSGEFHWNIDGAEVVSGTGNTISLNTEIPGERRIQVTQEGRCRNDTIDITITVLDVTSLGGDPIVVYNVDDAIDGIYPTLLEQNPNIINPNVLSHIEDYNVYVEYQGERFDYPSFPSPNYDDYLNGKYGVRNPLTGVIEGNTVVMKIFSKEYPCQNVEYGILIQFLPSESESSEGDCFSPYDGKWIESVKECPGSYVEAGDTIFLNNTEAFVWFGKECQKDSTMAGKTVVLNQDLYLCGKFWSPIAFAGNFDGQDHNIVGLQIHTEDYGKNAGHSNAAMFSSNSGSIYNLNLKDVYISDSLEGNIYRASLVAENHGCVKKCTADGEVTVITPKISSSYIGGIVGYNAGVVENCVFSGTINMIHKGEYSESSTGGIVGLNSGLINACINDGEVVSNGFGVGGIAGATYGKIINCANRNTVSGEGRFGDFHNAHFAAGGIVGTMGRTTSLVANCYNIGSVEGNDLVGEADGRNVVNCYKTSSNRAVADTYGFSYVYYFEEYAGSSWPQGNVSFEKGPNGTYILKEETFGTFNLIEALNAWVEEQNDSVYMLWQPDTSNINNGYPYLFLSPCQATNNEIDYERPEFVCKNVPFKVRVSGGDSYQWYVNDIFLTAHDSADVTISSTDNSAVLSIKITKNDCKHTIRDTIIFDKETPFLLKEWNDVVAINNADTQFVSYQWYRDGMELYGETDQYFYEPGGLSVGAYNAKIWKTDGSTIETCPILINEEFRSLTLVPSVDIYPNPAQANAKFHVLFSDLGNLNIEIIQIVDNIGNIVLNSKDTSFDQTFTLPVGFYIVYAKLTNGRIISKEIVVLK